MQLRSMHLMNGAILVCCLFRLVHSKNPYVLVDDYSPDAFFDGFRFYTGNDPTNGFVQYVNRSYAEQNGLIDSFADHVIVGVDDTNVYNAQAGPGRPSVRLETLQTYTHGLFILSLNHMPYGCGTWPAFWSLGPNWPNNGEVDIIEGVNQNDDNIMVLHTNSGCTIAGANETGTLLTNDCDSSGDDRSGCGVLDGSTSSYGAGFNAAGGGVYAMEWTSSYIRTWYFGADHIPTSIQDGPPDPSRFGKPAANFQGSCDIDSHFNDHYLIFDVTFCGDYAGNVYSQSTCPNYKGGYDACKAYVANNPSEFSNVFWSINYLRVYQQEEASTSSSSSAPLLSSVTPVAATSTGILSSLDPMGVNSKSSRVGSSTLSVPSSTHSGFPHMSSTRHNSSVASTKMMHPTSSKRSSSSKAGSKSSKVTSSLTTITRSSRPTTTDVPVCHAIFKDVNDSRYRIYCNSTIKGETLEETTTSTFANCMKRCDLSEDMCVGCAFSNSTDPPSCVLKANSKNSTVQEPGIVGPAKNIFAALRLGDDLTTSSYTGRTRTTGPLSVSTQTLGTITKTIGAEPHPGPTHHSKSKPTEIHSPWSISLCFTCGLVPTIVTSGHQPSPMQSDKGGQIPTTHPPKTIPGACNVARTIIITKLVQRTITKCPVPLTCPAQPTRVLPPVNAGSGIPGHLICTSRIPLGTLYTDAAGMVYQIYCGETIEGSDLSQSTVKSLSECMTVCDNFNFVHFDRNGCSGVSFDEKSGTCHVRSNGTPRTSERGTDSAVLLSNVAGGGGTDSGGNGGSDGNGMESSIPTHHTGYPISTIETQRHTILSSHDTTKPHAGDSGTAVHTSYLVSTHISNGHTIISTYGTTTLSESIQIQTSYLVSTRVSNGHTILSTYGITTKSTSAHPSVFTAVSTIVSNGHTSLSTSVSTAGNSNGNGGEGPGNSILTVTQGGSVYTITGRLVTVTESGAVLTVTRDGVVRTVTQHDVSYEISYVFATETITTGGGGGSSSSSSSRTCRTAATHYAQVNQRRKRSVLDFRPQDAFGMEQPFGALPVARPISPF